MPEHAKGTAPLTLRRHRKTALMDDPLGTGGLQDLLFELYEQLIGYTDLTDGLQRMNQVVANAFAAERSTIYLLLPETQELESVALLGKVAKLIRLPLRETSLAGYCARHNRAFRVEDAYGELSHIDPILQHDHTWDEVSGFRTRDVMCAPARFHGELIGVVQVMNGSQGPFTEMALQDLRFVARVVAYALYHLHVYNELATLKQLKKEKAEFMRTMVHELKSPVAAAKMMMDTLAFTRPDDEQIKNCAGRVGARLDELNSLVVDILELSRVNAGAPLGEVKVLDLSAETQRVFAAYVDQAHAKELDMRCACPPEPVRVRFDRQGLRIVISNLISNAVKYTGAGTVGVRVTSGDHTAILRVEDSGIGIPEADQPKLFHEFFRASNARKSRIPGTGVGLAGVKDLVERFDGHLELTSAENEGTTFTIHLPLCDTGLSHGCEPEVER